MDFKEIPEKYRPIPFWSWNERLDTEETAEQVKLMHTAGIGGYFMHARGGLQTEYMSEDWFLNVGAAICEGEKLGMRSWAYDENGWPSGFGNGAVNGMGVKYRQKYLRMSGTPASENQICKCGAHWFYFEINPYYVDVLDRDAVGEFIKAAYEPYYERFGNRIEGFFTDEPQISRDGIPWSFVFESEYKKRYNENICDRLEELFLPVGDYKLTRIKFWKMVTELFSESFLKQIYDWCDERNLKLTGHLVCEESLLSQLTANGACMPHYEYFHIPGMDWLGHDIFDCLTPVQTSSVAAQLGREQVIAETFAMCGHGTSMAELKGIYEWQMVHGINLLCQHLEGYSVRGMRKRDYPPAMYYQQPWWSEYKKFNDTVSRVGRILSEGRENAHILLIHPMTTAWSMFDGGENQGLDELDSRLLGTMKILEGKHLPYHLGDEIIMERHAYAADGYLVIGRKKYDTVIVSCCEALLDSTKRLLEEFVNCGGRIAAAEELEENPVTDNCEIGYTRRDFADFSAHYFVNTSGERKNAKINVCGRALDIYTGEAVPFGGSHEFEPWGSLMVIEDQSKSTERSDEKKEIVKADGEFEIIKASDNMLTLDRCDYYFDGVLEEKNGYVLNICERANELKREVDIHWDYHVRIEDLPGRLELVCETPEIFDISVNNIKINKKIIGTVIDKSFKRIDISEYIRTGENTISFDCRFRQDDYVYECLERAKHFETEKNKLVYNIEIEPIYLSGDFSLKTEGEWKDLGGCAVEYTGDFVIAAPGRRINLKHIEKQGYPFFCGSMTLEGELDIRDILEFDMTGVGALTAEIKGERYTLLTDNRADTSRLGISGRTKVRLEFTNNLRNLMGPHHLGFDSRSVAPASFYKEPCVWNGCEEQPWSGGYCFTETSI